MKTELEKKLNKLPAYITIEYTDFWLKISKADDFPSKETIFWTIQYIDSEGNSALYVQHSSLQAAVDTTLKEIKNL